MVGPSPWPVPRGGGRGEKRRVRGKGRRGGERYDAGMAAEVDFLLAEARGGAEGALGRLLEQYGQYLTLLARMQIGKRLQGKVDAADLVQEVFLSVHRQFPQFRGSTEAEFVTWLRRIMAGQFALL